MNHQLQHLSCLGLELQRLDLRGRGAAHPFKRRCGLQNTKGVYDHEVSVRELVVLGTASQAPTRSRNHNGYLLRWDGEGILFDPGEGTQRQMAHAGVAANEVTRLCITHFHGDHVLGVPGIVQRMSLDRLAHPVHAHYPASGAQYFERLRHATPFYEVAALIEQPVTGDGVVATGEFGSLMARRLEHSIDAYGYRLVEPDGRRML